MKALILLVVLCIFACESRSRRYYYYDRHDDDYRAVISRIKDIAVNKRFDVQATLIDEDGDRIRERTYVELSLLGGDRYAVLRGDTDKTTRNGRVTFSNLRIDREGDDYRIKLIFDVDGEEFYEKSNKFDVLDRDYYDDDDDGISVGGSLFSVDMDGMPDRIEAGRALPDLTFTMRMFGNKSTGGTVTLKLRDADGDKRDDALLVWRKPSLSASVRSGKAIFTEAFFTQRLDEGAELIAQAVRFFGTEEFFLPRVRSSDIMVDVSRITVSTGNTKIYGVLRIEDRLCTDCTVNAYLVSNKTVKDAGVTTTNQHGEFTATITNWSCSTGTSYQGAVKVFYARSNYYARLSATCN